MLKSIDQHFTSVKAPCSYWITQSLVLTVALAALAVGIANTAIGKSLGVSTSTLKFSAALGGSISLALLIGIDAVWERVHPKALAATPKPKTPEPPKSPVPLAIGTEPPKGLPKPKALPFKPALLIPVDNEDIKPASPVPTGGGAPLAIAPVVLPVPTGGGAPLAIAPVVLKDHATNAGALVHDLEGIWDKFLGNESLSAEKTSYLDAHYYYRGVAGDGNCFFYSILAGMLHLYAEAGRRGEEPQPWENPLYLMDDILSCAPVRCEREKQIVINGLLKISDSPTKETLLELFNDHSFMKEAAYYLRIRSINHFFKSDPDLAAAEFPLGIDEAIREYSYASMNSCMTALNSLMITHSITYYRDFDAPFNAESATINEPPPFMVIFHASHCECLIRKDLVRNISAA
jgi:hypothetical protein